MAGVFAIIRSSKKNQDTYDYEDDNDDLDSSLNKNLNELSKNETSSKKIAKSRKTFILKKYKVIASFYNDYKFIDYKKKSNKKLAKKQMADIVNILDKNLNEMEEFFSHDSVIMAENIDYKFILVGVITFKLIKSEKLKAVNVDLKKLYKLGELADFDIRLMDALERILTPFEAFEND